MKNINWKVRFSKENQAFWIRFILALIVPILAYFGLKMEDITSWKALGELTLKFVANPYLVGLTVVNALNMVPDPTTQGIGDSKQALAYTEPKKNEVEGGCLN